MGLLLGATALTGSLWAGQLSTSIEVTAGNPAAEGRIATVSSVATTPTLVTTGGKEATVTQILNVTLYQVTNIAPGHENDMSLQFSIINPQEMGQIFGSDKAILQLKVTDFFDETVVFAEGTAQAKDPLETLLPRGVPSGTTKLTLRGDVQFQKGVPEDTMFAPENLETFLEVTHENPPGEGQTATVSEVATTPTVVTTEEKKATIKKS